MKKFIFQRSEKATDFYCSRCKKDKKAKNTAYNAKDPSEVICNGCYGLLLSKNLIERGYA